MKMIVDGNVMRFSVGRVDCILDVETGKNVKDCTARSGNDFYHVGKVKELSFSNHKNQDLWIGEKEFHVYFNSRTRCTVDPGNKMTCEGY